VDRDVYLILLGAGISLASSIVTLILQFFLGQWGERMRSKREEKQQQSREIRSALMDKSLPMRPGGTLLKRIERSTDDLDIPTFLRRRGTGGGSKSQPRGYSPLEIAFMVGGVIFTIWTAAVLIT
jgi:hypothetical protein